MKTNTKTTAHAWREDSIEILNQCREELIRNRKENDELREEIRRLKYMLLNRHILLG